MLFSNQWNMIRSWPSWSEAITIANQSVQPVPAVLHEAKEFVPVKNNKKDKPKHCRNGPQNRPNNVILYGSGIKFAPASNKQTNRGKHPNLMGVAAHGT